VYLILDGIPMCISYLNDVVGWSKNYVYSSINISEKFQLDAQISMTIDVKIVVNICMLSLIDVMLK
jgi:hypothetical protein